MGLCVGSGYYYLAGYKHQSDKKNALTPTIDKPTVSTKPLDEDVSCVSECFPQWKIKLVHSFLLNNNMACIVFCMLLCSTKYPSLEAYLIALFALNYTSFQNQGTSNSSSVGKCDQSWLELFVSCCSLSH